ncbi:MAG: hypothetical protein IK116_00100 [Firmicutes bacterium]|nr:hypothetical protein [Bacillota bacterium]
MDKRDTAQRNTPIEMISVCRGDGQLRPLRFRLADGTVVRISRVDETRRLEAAGITALLYFCRACLDGREFRFQLRYLVKSHRWVLFEQT